MYSAPYCTDLRPNGALATMPLGSHETVFISMADFDIKILQAGLVLRPLPQLLPDAALSAVRLVTSINNGWYCDNLTSFTDQAVPADKHFATPEHSFIAFVMLPSLHKE